MVLGAVRRRMTDALAARRGVVVVGSSRETQALATRLAESFDVTYVSDRAGLVDAARAEGVDAHRDSLDDETDLCASDIAVDAADVATDHDRTSLLLAQRLTTSGEITDLVVRVNDPAREDAFAALGAETVCGPEVLAPEIGGALGEGP